MALNINFCTSLGVNSHTMFVCMDVWSYGDSDSKLYEQSIKFQYEKGMKTVSHL